MLLKTRLDAMLTPLWDSLLLFLKTLELKVFKEQTFQSLESLLYQLVSDHLAKCPQDVVFFFSGPNSFEDALISVMDNGLEGSMQLLDLLGVDQPLLQLLVGLKFS